MLATIETDRCRIRQCPGILAVGLPVPWLRRQIGPKCISPLCSEVSDRPSTPLFGKPNLQTSSTTHLSAWVATISQMSFTPVTPLRRPEALGITTASITRYHDR